MLIVVFDTETSGLFPKDTKDIELYPYMIQLSCILFNTHTKKIEETIDSVINVKNIVLSDEITELTNITNEMIQNGVDIQNTLNNFNILLSKCDLLIGHNIEFDLKVINTEMTRNNIKLNYSEEAIRTRTYCTMKKSINLCKIEQTNSFGKYYKWPKLDELHFYLFNKKLKNMHNAFNDTLICLRCYMFMVCIIDIIEEEDIKERIINLLL